MKPTTVRRHLSTDSPRTIRLGIVGCGEVMRAKHLPALTKHAGVEITVAADVDLDRCRQLAAQFAIPRTCTTIEELLQTPDLDAVAVCTPPATHAELAIAALRAGKHVWVDKPLALNEDDCRRLMEEAARAGTIAMTGFHMRVHRLIAQARATIRRGELGRIQSVRLVWHGPRSDTNIPAWKTHRITGGGALVEIAPHHLDLLRFLLGCELAEIFAFSNTDVRDDENAVISARMSNGVLVSGEFSERAAHEMQIIISGSAALLTVDCLKFEGFQIRAIKQRPGSPATRIREGWHFLRSLPSGIGIMRRGGDYHNSFTYAWNAFFQAIRTGNTQALPTLHDGLRTTQAVCAALKSLEQKCAVPIALMLEAAHVPDTRNVPEVNAEINRPIFSVVTPTFNRPDQLKNLLDQLARQQLPGPALEVIVVDDGGSEPLEPIIAPLRDRLNIRLIRQANAGCAAARQLGIEAARGLFLAFTDDDCRPSPDWLSQLHATLVRHPGSAVAGPTLNALTTDLRSETTQLIVNWFVREQTDAEGRLSYGPTCNLAFPAEPFRQVGGLDKNWRIAGGEDRDLCARWLGAGQTMIYQPQAQVLHYHALTLRQFLRQHFQYGRGAHKFRQGLRPGDRPVRARASLSSYFRLMGLPWRQFRGLTAWKVSGYLVLAQMATGAGMLSERFRPDRATRALNSLQPGLLGQEALK